jgi:hypothetical protein
MRVGRTVHLKVTRLKGREFIRKLCYASLFGSLSLLC